MTSEGEQSPVIRIGLLDDTLGVRRNAPEREPVIATARDIGQLLTAYQQAVYATYAIQQGWNSIRRLTREERERYALRIVGQEEDSFFILLAVGSVIDPLTVFTAAISTISTIASVVSMIIAYKALQLQQLQQLQQLDGRDKRALSMLRRSVASIAEVSLRTNHVVSINNGPNGQPHFSTNLESSIAIRRLASNSQMVPTSDIPEFEFSNEYLEDAEVIGSNTDSQPLRAYAPRYHDAIRLSFGQGYSGTSQSISEGAIITARGLATREKGDPSTSAPLLFQIDEILDVRYRR